MTQRQIAWVWRLVFFALVTFWVCAFFVIGHFVEKFW